jgi:hypothetical protein
MSKMASTSLAAYRSIDLSELESKVIEVIECSGIDGCISDEIRVVYPSLSYSSITARFASLEEKGEIFRNGETRPGKSGRQQKVMRHASFATAVLTTSSSKAKHGAFVRGMMVAAKIVLKAGDYGSAKAELAKELRARAKI